MVNRQISGAAAAFGLVGAFAICLGSLVGIAAPHDGQTSMVMFPLWLFGAMWGVMAIIAAFWSTVRVRWLVLALAAISVLSVVVAFRAG